MVGRAAESWGPLAGGHLRASVIALGTLLGPSGRQGQASGFPQVTCCNLKERADLGQHWFQAWLYDLRAVGLHVPHAVTFN